MLLAMISALDIIIGIMLMIPGILLPVAFYLGVLMFIKGLSSVIGGLMGSEFIIILGLIDILAGLMVIFNFTIPWFWLVVLLKGTYSFIVGVFAR